MSNVYVVSAFPGIGKTFATKKLSESGYAVSDSDSSKFSKDNFPKNYIKHIENKIEEYDKLNSDKPCFIFVSSHKEVRDALIENDIEFTLFYPHLSNKDEMIERYIERGSPQPFINLLDNNFENWVREITRDSNILHKYQVDEYLYDVLERILSL